MFLLLLLSVVPRSSEEKIQGGDENFFFCRLFFLLEEVCHLLLVLLNILRFFPNSPDFFLYSWGEEKMDSGASLREQRIQELWEQPSRIFVRVNGLKHIDSHILMREINEIRSARSIKKAVEAIELAKHRWSALGLVKEVHYTLEPIEDGTVDDVGVNLTLRDSKFSLSGGVQAEGVSTTPAINFALNNLWRGKVGLHGTYTPPALKRHSFNFSTVYNYPPWPFGQKLEVVAGLRRDCKSFHVAEETTLREVKIVTTHLNHPATHVTTVGLQRRTNFSRIAMPLECLGSLLLPSEKLYLANELIVSRVQFHEHPSTRAVLPLPIRGQFVHLRAEAATTAADGQPLGSLQSVFVKTEAVVHRYVALHPLASLAISGRVGALMPLSRDGPLPLNDRFFLGWRNVRGFKSVGPSTNDWAKVVEQFGATGGNAIWAASLSLNLPFPLFPANGLVTSHCFLNAGNCALIPRGEWRARLGGLLQDAKVAVGCGLVLVMPGGLDGSNGKIELNWSLPILQVGRRGLRIGAENSHLVDSLRFGCCWCTDE